jgi:hypothetical protein
VAAGRRRRHSAGPGAALATLNCLRKMHVAPDRILDLRPTTFSKNAEKKINLLQGATLILKDVENTMCGRHTPAKAECVSGDPRMWWLMEGR